MALVPELVRKQLPERQAANELPRLRFGGPWLAMVNANYEKCRIDGQDCGSRTPPPQPRGHGYGAEL
jgi:hypothetical protein